MGYLILCGSLWAVFIIIGIFMRAAIPTTVQPEPGDVWWIVLWTGVGAVLLTVFIAGIIGLWGAI